MGTRQTRGSACGAYLAAHSSTVSGGCISQSTLPFTDARPSATHCRPFAKASWASSSPIGWLSVGTLSPDEAAHFQAASARLRSPMFATMIAALLGNFVGKELDLGCNQLKGKAYLCGASGHPFRQVHRIGGWLESVILGSGVRAPSRSPSRPRIVADADGRPALPHPCTVQILRAMGRAKVVRRVRPHAGPPALPSHVLTARMPREDRQPL